MGANEEAMSIAKHYRAPVYAGGNPDHATIAAWAYRWHRQRGHVAHRALSEALADADKGRKRYPRTSQDMPAWAPVSNDLRWCEDTARAGLRFVGFADDIAPRAVDHKGWWIDPDGCGESYRGAVWQLPARDGCPVYVSGYADPYNPGAARIDIRRLTYGEPGGLDRGNTGSVSDAARDAAMYADDIARCDAEREREYQEAWREGSRAAELESEARDTRRGLLRLLADIKADRRDGMRARDAVCDVIRAKVADMVEAIRKARAKRDDVVSEWQRAPGFADGYGESC